MNTGGFILKRLGLILTIFLFITPEISNIKTVELVELTELASDHSLMIEAWTVTIKEKISVDKANEIIERLNKDHTIHSTEDKNVIKYSITSAHNSEGVFVSYNVVIPKNKQHQVELIAIIDGTEFNDSILKKYESELMTIQNNYFTEKSRVFTCLITTKDVNIESDDFLNVLSKELELKYVSTQSDKINKLVLNETLYGYTPLWGNKLIVKDTPLNIQIVIQSTKNKKQKVIIGTPILINEY